MMDTLANVVDHAGTILLLLEPNARFSQSLQTMLKRMTIIFGQDWWSYVVIGVSKWPYDQDSIDDREERCEDRPDKCQDEAWFCREFNAQLREKLQTDEDFKCVFTDSWSQAEDNIGDPVQQEHWIAQTGILWDITVSREEDFHFMTIDDILEENAKMREDIKWLQDVITNNITQLSQEIDDNRKDIGINKDRIDNNKESIDNLEMAPVGTIIAWVPKPTKGSSETVDIPDGWVKCDGSIIPKGSIWAGQLTPDLNNGRRFLRGGQDKDALTLEEDMVQSHAHSLSDPGHRHGYTDSYSQFTLIGSQGFMIGNNEIVHHGRKGTHEKSNIAVRKSSCYKMLND